MQTSDENCSIAIIGGGFTGTVLAAQLLRHTSFPIKLIEPSHVGHGVAYSTECPWHLLNVHAGNMSAIADDPRHFLDWARLNHEFQNRAEDYIPRRVYAAYVEHLLREQASANPGRLLIVPELVTGIIRNENGFELQLGSGSRTLAEKVVLALGNPPPRDLHLHGRTGESCRYIADPWAAGALKGISGEDEDVLLIGSGLTGIDVALALRERGFAGTIHMLSRHGLVPHGHVGVANHSRMRLPSDLPTAALQLLKFVREQVAAVERQGDNWRDVMDALRSCTQQIWRSLSFEEKRRFLRHLRAYWDVHRHRIAPAVHARVRSEIQDGRIRLHAGRIMNYCQKGECDEVSYRERKTGTVQRIEVGHVINCTGPDYDCRGTSNPLLRDLFSRGMARPDALSLGIDVNDRFEVLGADGSVTDSLYALGPLLKGTLWETIAVPEIRVQIAALTLLLADNGKRRWINSSSPVHTAGEETAIIRLLMFRSPHRCASRTPFSEKRSRLWSVTVKESACLASMGCLMINRHITLDRSAWMGADASARRGQALRPTGSLIFCD